MSITSTIPNLRPTETIVSDAMSVLSIQPIMPNIRYVIVDETLQLTPLLIKLKLMVMTDSQCDFYITVEESSEISRWATSDEYEGYFHMRIKQLEKFRTIYVTTKVLDESFFFIQFTVFLTGVRLPGVLKVCKSIENQIISFRKNSTSKG